MDNLRNGLLWSLGRRTVKVDEQNIFWVVGAGAHKRVLLLGIVLPAIQHWIGMPSHVLYGLTAWAIGSLIYNVVCLGFADRRNPYWLRGIMTANALYCVLIYGRGRPAQAWLN